MSAKLKPGCESAITETWVSPDAKWMAHAVDGVWVLSRAKAGVFLHHGTHPSLEAAMQVVVSRGGAPVVSASDFALEALAELVDRYDMVSARDTMSAISNLEYQIRKARAAIAYHRYEDI